MTAVAAVPIGRWPITSNTEYDDRQALVSGAGVEAHRIVEPGAAADGAVWIAVEHVVDAGGYNTVVTLLLDEREAGRLRDALNAALVQARP